MKEELGLTPELIMGGGGVFDVKADGRLLYSKHKTGLFPEPYEVINQLRPVD